MRVTRRILKPAILCAAIALLSTIARHAAASIPAPSLGAMELARTSHADNQRRANEQWEREKQAETIALVVCGLLFIGAIVIFVVIVNRASSRAPVLRVRRGEPMPRLCVCCGRPSEYVRTRTVNESSPTGTDVPDHVTLGILLWVLIWQAIAFVVTAFATWERQTVEAHFCHEHRSHWAYRKAGFTLFLLLLWPAVVYLCVTIPPAFFDDDYASMVGAAGWIVGLCYWPLILVHLRLTGVRCRDATRLGYTLIGVHPDVIAAAPHDAPALAAHEALASMTATPRPPPAPPAEEELMPEAPDRSPDPSHVARLCPALRRLLDLELCAGNSVAETSIGWPRDGAVFVLLGGPFRAVAEGLHADLDRRPINDPHWWKEEIEHKPTGHVLACRF